MSKQKVIVFDCDEVLLDHLAGFREWVKKKYNFITKTEYPTDYSLCDWLEIDEHTDVQKLLNEFNSSTIEFGLLKPIHESVRSLLHSLRHCYPDAVFAILTKSGTHGHAEVLRHVNIQHVFPDIFDEIHIVETYQTKRGALAKLQAKYNVVCLVDDYIDNIETAVSLGIHGIMLKRPHNVQFKDRPDFYFAENWNFIVHNIVLQMSKGE